MKSIIKIGKAMIMPVVVYLFFSVVTNGRFGTMQTIISIIRTGTVPLLLAMGMSFNMSMGMWDFSAGAIVYASAIFSSTISNQFGWGVLGMCILSVVIAIAMSAFTGFLYNRLMVPSLVLSLGLAMAYEALPFLLTKNATGRIGLTEGFLASMPYCLIVVAVMFVIYSYLTNLTVFGHNVKAIGSNIEIANNAGISLTKTKFLGFLAGGLFLGVAGFEYMSLNTSVSASGGFGSISIIFDAMMGIFLAALIGRYVNYSVAVIIGVFTIRMLGTGLIASGLSSQIRSTLTGFFLLVVIAYSSNQGRLKAHKRKLQIRDSANADYLQKTGG